MKLGEGLWDRTLQWRSFYESSVDQQVRAKMITRVFYKGLSDSGVAQIIDANRSQCRLSLDVTQCFAGSGTADTQLLEDVRSVVSYCNSLMHAANVYDVRISRDDITTFINTILKPTFSSAAAVNWTTVERRANDVFTCLQNTTSNTISFRYDFKTLLKEIIPLLPSVQAGI